MIMIFWHLFVEIILCYSMWSDFVKFHVCFKRIYIVQLFCSVQPSCISVCCFSLSPSLFLLGHKKKQNEKPPTVLVSLHRPSIFASPTVQGHRCVSSERTLHDDGRLQVGAKHCSRRRSQMWETQGQPMTSSPC